MLLGCDPSDLESLAERLAVLADHLTRVRLRLVNADRSAWAGPDARRGWTELDRICAELAQRSISVDLVARQVERQAAQQRSVSEIDHQVRTLALSHVGDGRWIGWVGPEDATVVVVLIPGVGTDLADRDSLAGDAIRVREHLALVGAREQDADTVAVVSWFGYDPPDNIVAGVGRSPAVDGAERLAADVDRWRLQPGRRVVAVGHSYGALVVSRAAAIGMAADEVVLLGAPGLGADVGRPGWLAGQGLWSAAADGDPVSALARAGLIHGEDPASVAVALPTSIDGHGSYLRDPVLLDALAEVALRGGTSGTVAAGRSTSSASPARTHTLGATTTWASP